MNIKTLKTSTLKNWDKNPREIEPDLMEALKKYITKYGLLTPLLVDGRDQKTVLGGNMRLKALLSLGIKEIECNAIEIKTDEEALEIALLDNNQFGTYIKTQLVELVANSDLNLEDFQIDLKPVSLDSLMPSDDPEHEKLTDKFIIPPFSVLDTRQGYWQDRKREWLSLGIKSEEGRDSKVFNMGLNANKDNNWEISDNKGSGVSIFDPVLCEISYKWFTPVKGKVLDPFAGGSVRGIVADRLGYDYTGIELSTKQVAANKLQGKELESDAKWINGDSNVELDKLDKEYDIIFSCPPYEDLEVYSDDPADISNMSHDDFNDIYRSIISKAVSKLNENRFAVWVVGEVRGKSGAYSLFIPYTIECFKDAGMEYYNEMIIVNTAGTLPIRVTRQFQSGRKIGKMHQNVLVFYKGDPKKVKNEFKDIEIDG